MPEFQKPNLYQLQGRHVHVTYSTSGIDGRPHLTYQDAQQTLSFNGDEIRTAESEIGTLVTVSLRRTVDTGNTTFTLIVPTVNLAQGNHHLTIHTRGITTVHRYSPVPAFNQGQAETYSFAALTGTASFVFF
jgi:hypothetical protein